MMKFLIFFFLRRKGINLATSMECKHLGHSRVAHSIGEVHVVGQKEETSFASTTSTTLSQDERYALNGCNLSDH
jgi:hypothetical protein